MKIMIEMQVLLRMNDPRILEISLLIASREDRQTSSQTNLGLTTMDGLIPNY